MTDKTTSSWAKANEAYLDQQLDCLRRLLQLRVLWLRTRWRQDPLQSYQGLVISDSKADELLAADRQAEARFYREDQAAAEASREVTDAWQKLAELTRQLIESGQPPALEVLARQFALAPFEKQVLLLCLAPQLDSSFERLYGYVQDDVHRTHPTADLALGLFADGDEPLGARDAFLPEAPLQRYLLVAEVAAASPEPVSRLRPLCLDDRITDYLRGVNRLDERIASLLEPLPPLLVGAAHRELAERLATAIGSSSQRGRWPLLNLVGPSGTGKRTVARAIGRRLNVEFLSLDHKRLPASAEMLQRTLRLLDREAALLPAVVYAEASQSAGDEAGSAALEAISRQLDALVIVGSRQVWRTDRETLVVNVPVLEASPRGRLWRQALDGVPHELNGLVDEIVQQFDFGPETIVRVVAAAQGKARLHAAEDPAVQADDLWQACREESGWRLDDLAQRILPCHTWDDIVLSEPVFDLLREIAAQVSNRARVYDQWGFASRMSRGRGISALFCGPSGTGKTMAAEILANHLRLDLYRIDLAGVVSKYVGETEKNLRKVFDNAEQCGAVLFFDEADALFGKRTEVKDSHDRYANIEVNYLLQRMEDYRGLAILATNRKSDLDPAFMRRLRFLVDFSFPEFTCRRLIWQKVFPTQAPLDALDYDGLARMEIPGGNIKNISLNAAFLAADRDVPIGMDEVMHAARREYAKIDKLPTPAEFGSYDQPNKPARKRR